uniref:Uncharacterized protein n=1 Tax=viral metagenome TaxID=1070528 RepID=A0A6C0ACM3_9ZZZZ
MKNYHRGTDDTDTKPRNSNVNAEIRKLIASGKNDYNVLSQLRGKYNNNDDLVEAIFDGYKERLEYIQKKAKKFRQLIYDRYSRYNLTISQLLKKAKKYQKRYELSDDEFEIFKNHVMSDKSYNQSSVTLPNTAMAKTLGYGPTLSSGEKLHVRENEFDILQDILKVHSETKPLHSNVILQTLTYRDCAPEALNGVYDKDKQNVYSYVHPIVAALFLPQIRYLEEHMLIASLSEIVKIKHEGKPILTKPNYELYYDLITDPNDTVCDMSSPLNDLRNRIVLQCRLWDAVMNLRQGKYYNDRLVEFLVAVENCRNNVYDVPDLTYVKDEGAILRRLLSAFSLRPTAVSTVPLYNIISNNPHLNPMAVTQVTTIPMITLRLPLKIYHQNITVNLDKALQQAHWFVENKMLVPKSQSIIHSREVLFFHVGKRYNVVNVARHTAPYNFERLPMTVSGLESINNIPVGFRHDLQVKDDTFYLRSCVFINTTKVEDKEIITGCNAGVVCYENGMPTGAKLYNPQDAHLVGNAPICNMPLHKDQLSLPAPPSNQNGGALDTSFDYKAETYGTIFVYVKARTANNGTQYIMNN